MVGQSPALTEIRNQIARVAPTNGRVLVLGESGTGKELIARAVHKMSHREKNPFIKVNCAAIPEELIESELFGSDRGAFTGAVKTRDGKFLQADGGTLFLDEIGDMSLSVQAKVLRALEQGEFERVGGAKTFRVDVRVIAATTQKLARRSRARQISRRPLLPPECGATDSTALAGAPRRHPRTGRTLPQRLCRRKWIFAQNTLGRSAGPALAIRLARQHPRTEKLGRTALNYGFRRHHLPPKIYPP